MLHLAIIGIGSVSVFIILRILIMKCLTTQRSRLREDYEYELSSSERDSSKMLLLPIHSKVSE